MTNQARRPPRPDSLTLADIDLAQVDELALKVVRLLPKHVDGHQATMLAFACAAVSMRIATDLLEEGAVADLVSLAADYASRYKPLVVRDARTKTH